MGSHIDDGTRHLILGVTVIVKSGLIPAENDEEKIECLVEVFSSVVQTLYFGLFWNSEKCSLNGRLQHPFALHHFLETTVGHQAGCVASF